MSSSSSSRAELAHAARLYYHRGLTQQEVGRRLGVSRFRVMRLLEAARAEGVVRIEIEGDLGQEDDLAARLEATFDLDLAVVVPESGGLARAGAATLPLLLRAGDLVGVAWGETLSALVAELAPPPTRHDVVQICGAIPGLATGTGPSEVAVRLAERLGGSVSLLPAPARPATLDELLDDETIRPTLALFDQVQVALVGIGPHASGGGHVLVHVFGPDGSVLDPEPALALSLEGLRRARTVAVAGGESKHGAILAVLRARILSGLITDEASARHALESA
jgi:deoxyribonucleoside regulator